MEFDATSIFDMYRVAESARPHFKRGDRVRLLDALGGAVGEVVDAYGPGLWQLRLADGTNVAISEHVMRKAVPTWRPGDVVVVRFPGVRTSYTYVRGRADWPGDSALNRTDAHMDALYVDGKLTPVLQAGGVPFDGGRL